MLQLHFLTRAKSLVDEKCVLKALLGHVQNNVVRRMVKQATGAGSHLDPVLPVLPKQSHKFSIIQCNLLDGNADLDVMLFSQLTCELWHPWFLSATWWGPFCDLGQSIASSPVLQCPLSDGNKQWP